MSWWKKLSNLFIKRWYLFLLIVVLFLLIIFLVIKIGSTNEKVLFGTYLDNYCYSIYDENEEFYVRIYTNKEESMYFVKENVDKCYFKNMSQSGDGEDSFRANLNSLKNVGQVVIDGYTYYEYLFGFLIPFKETTPLIYDKFCLEIDYLNEEEINVELGSLCLLTNRNDTNNLIISSLKGETKFEDNIETLSKIYLNFGELKNLEIKRIKVINSLIDESMYEVKNDGLNYTIELKGKFKFSIYRLAIEIDYVLNGISYTEIIDPFTFFTNNISSKMMKVYNEL